MLDFPDAPSEGEIFSAGGAAWTWTSGKWVASATGLPSLAQGEVLGNPDAGDAPAVAADLALMLRAALGDGTAGQVITSSGVGVDPVWDDVASAPIAKYIIGAFVPAAPVASQVLLLHQVSRAVTIPADFAAHAGYASRARARVAATASTTLLVQRATAAAPSTFSNVGTIVFAAGALTGTFSTSGVDVAYAAGDTLALVAPATVDATLAGFSATLVAREA